jgi:FkbM family methyltransferase
MRRLSWRERSRPLRHGLGALLGRVGIAAPPAVTEPAAAAPGTGTPPGARLSYAGHGEDLLVWAWLSVEGRLKGPEIRYLDIGAADPIHLNNTYLLSTLGASGVLVEPDPAQAAKLRAVRPRDLTIQAGVAFDGRRSATFTRFTSPLFNTFSPQQADKVVAASKTWHPTALQTVVDHLEVELIPINQILEEHGTPHFLSVDAESFDFPILQSLDFSRFRPWIICTEIMRPCGEIAALLNPHGYQFIGRTPDNVLFMLNPLPSNPAMVCD